MITRVGETYSRTIYKVGTNCYLHPLITFPRYSQTEMTVPYLPNQPDEVNVEEGIYIFHCSLSIPLLFSLLSHRIRDYCDTSLSLQVTTAHETSTTSTYSRPPFHYQFNEAMPGPAKPPPTSVSCLLPSRELWFQLICRRQVNV